MDRLETVDELETEMLVLEPGASNPGSELSPIVGELCERAHTEELDGLLQRPRLAARAAFTGKLGGLGRSRLHPRPRARAGDAARRRPLASATAASRPAVPAGAFESHGPAA